MKLLSTLLQNAVEDYLKQLDNVTLDDLEEICTFNLSNVAFIAAKTVEYLNKNTIQPEKVYETLSKTGKTLIGFPIGERINALISLLATALKYGYNMFYRVNETPRICYSIQHTYEDNNQIVAVDFEKIKK